MERRNFLFWLVAATAGVVLLAANLLNKVWFYILGPKLTARQAAKLIEERIENLERTSIIEKQREERLLKDKIFICKMDDLKKKEGLPFVDFDLKPALAFKGKEDKPILLTSVCPHLGCTIQSKLNEGKLLCPCHISYFELETGKLIEGPAPADIPLKMIPYVVENGKVYIVRNA